MTGKERVTKRILILDYVKMALGADVVRYQFKVRPTWDGEQYDIVGDLVVLWQRSPGQTKEGCEWGTHKGVIRLLLGSKEPAVSLHWGHYDLTGQEAIDDYEDREAKL